MKSFLLLLSISLFFASCSTYKSGQTPDDVYFSPERPKAEYVRVDDQDEDSYYRGEANRSSNDYYNYEEERYLRMKVRNHQRWSYLDNDFYSYNPYVYGNYNYYYNSPWNSYSYWDHFYNPYARQVFFYNAKSPVVNQPRMINLRTFSPQNNPSNNPRFYNSKTGSANNNRSYSAPRRSTGSDLRNIFNSGNNNNSSNFPSSNRTSTNSSGSSGSSSSGSSSGSSSAPARRF